MERKKFSFSMPIMKAYVDKATGKRYLEGVASTTDKDLHGDRMSKEAIQSMADSLKNLKNKSGTLNAEHEKSWQSELGEITELTVSKKNELVMKSVLNETSKANDLWYMLVDKGKKLGLSIGGFVKSFRIEVDEKTGDYMRVFEEIVLDHVAVVSQPANPKTWVSAISKSVNGVQLGAVTNSIVEPEETEENDDDEEDNLLTNKKVMSKEEEKKDAKLVEKEDTEDTKNTDASESETTTEETTESESKITEEATEKKEEEASTEKTEEETEESTEGEAEEDKAIEGVESVTKADLDAFKAEILSLLKKEEVKVDKKEEEKELEVNISDSNSDVVKSIQEIKDELVKINKLTSSRKTVEVEKFEGDKATQELTKEDLEKELLEIDKSFEHQPEQCFVKKGEVRRKYAELGIK